MTNRIRQRRLLVAAFLLGAVLLAGTSVTGVRAQGQSENEFRAGAATSNVTPKLGTSMNGLFHERHADHVHDELHARALFLDNGQTRFAFVVVDNCLIPREIFDEAKQQVHEKIDLPVDHMLMSATHTHSAATATPVFLANPDPEYLDYLTSKIADAVELAHNNLQPAEIGWGTGEVPEETFNRRWYMKEGTIPENPFDEVDQVETNPPRASENLIKPAGPTDPTLSILSVRSPEGRPIAMLANYSLHYVGGTGGATISADYFGAFAQRVKTLLGAEHQDPPFVGLMSNGASGDINNINFRKEGESKEAYEQIHHVANQVAAEALKVYEGIEHQNWVPLDVAQTEIELGVRKPSEESMARARHILAEADRPLEGGREIYARETKLLTDYPDRVPLILQAVRIGDLAISAIPCEVFVEIGLELKDRSPFGTTFTIALANGYNGYLPTPEQHRLGRYETGRARTSDR